MYRRSTKQKRVRSMGKPSKKQKKILLIVGITGVVYIGFKYLLPLVIPFLAAYLFAMCLKPSAAWIQKNLYINLKGKKRYLPIGIIGGLEFLVILILAGVGVYFGVEKICREITLLSDNLPVWIENLDYWLTGQCHSLENAFGLEPNCLVRLVREILAGLKVKIKETAMPFLMINSMTVVSYTVKVMIVGVIIFLGTILSLQEMESLKQRRQNSIFWKEYDMIGCRLMQAGRAFVKTQGTILLLTMFLCALGLWILKNPYYIILGIFIGLLDALPVFGTGTILIPWAIIDFVRGNFASGAVLIVLYLICYFMREFLEAKIMGNQMGLTPLESLVSLYVGWQLFGLLGFILGPIGLILIEDIIEAYENKEFTT